MMLGMAQSSDRDPFISEILDSIFSLPTHVNIQRSTERPGLFPGKLTG